MSSPRTLPHLKDDYDVVIVGAGAIGLATAWNLSRLGYEVLVVEAKTVGAGASRAAGGMLAGSAEAHFDDDPLTRLQRASLDRYQDFVTELESRTAMKVHYRDEGTLVVALDRDDTEALERAYQHQRWLGLPVERLGSDDVAALEPALSRVHSGVLCPRDHQIDNWHLVDALAVGLYKEGGVLLENTAVKRVLSVDDRVEGVLLDDGSRIRAAHVLITAGAWSRGIEGVPELRAFPVRPVRGQMLAIDCGTPPLCRHVVRTPDVYLVPKNDGSLVIGSTMEEVGYDANLTAGGVLELLKNAWRVMPGVYEQNLRSTWTGFRPVSLDNRPLLGPSRIEGLWIATGHGRHGILLTPITADLMTAMIHRGKPSDDWRAFSPDRIH
jgi:glycine oxidase